MTPPLRSLTVFLGSFAALCAVPELAAQTDVEARGRLHGVDPPAGYYEVLRRDPQAYRFSDRNGWKVRGGSVAAARRGRRAAAAAGATGAVPRAQFAEGVLGGDLNLAVFLVLYANSDSANTITSLPRDVFEQSLFGTDPESPYSVNRYYGEVSNDELQVKGTVFEWTRVSGDDDLYEAECNGLCSAANVPFTDMIAEVVQYHDAAVDFGQFDNDGVDGVPNSGDDDGFVDAIVLFHPEVDGACGTDNLWAHRWSYRGRRGGDLATADTAFGGGQIKVRDYIVQGGQGGENGCTGNQPQAIGVVTHELGHLFGLPDLYDTIGEGEGIGWWGLMGSGNWRRPDSPAHLGAWSKAELGWVTEVFIPSDTALAISPVILSDTTYVLPIADRDEYFILENRQPIGSDARIVQPGLLIWHVDSVLLRQRRPFNSVNGSQPNALALEQADGRVDLLVGANRGDRSDPFPGIANVTRFGPATFPSSAAWNGTPSYVVVDSITQELTGEISVQIRLELPTVISATRSQAVFRLDGVERTQFEERLAPGTEHTLEMDEAQLVDGGRRRYTWMSWSNGQPRSHTFTAAPRGDSIVATVSGEYLLRVGRNGAGGSVTADIPVDLVTGELLAEGTALSLTATLDSAGHVFEGWSGDTASSDPVVTLDMQRPFELTATFAAPLALSDATPPDAVMGAPYTHHLTAGGGTGEYGWELAGGDLPPGLRFSIDGFFSGIPRFTGPSSFTARVTSGSQTVEQSFTLNVVAPVLVVANVVQHLVGVGQVLTPDEIRYLDLLGNQTGQFDLGDFLAWVEATGGVVSAAEMAEVLRMAPAPEPARRRQP